MTTALVKRRHFVTTASSVVQITRQGRSVNKIKREKNDNTEPEDSDAAMQEMSKMRIANSVGFFGLRDKENGGVVPNKKYNTLW
jgi:hypothetical protein